MTERQDHEVEDAEQIYLLMKEDYRISRNVRLAWFLSRLNQVVWPASKSQLLNSENELDLLSVLPKGWQEDLSPPPALPPHSAPCRLIPSTRATFLARRYRFIIQLDLSPSTGIVDDSTGEMIFDEVFQALSRCLAGLAQPFQVPGTDQLFQPKIFITILAYSSIIGLAAHQVLVQGCQLDQTDLDDFLLHIYQQLKALESSIAEVLHQQHQQAGLNQPGSLEQPGSLDQPPTRKQGVSVVTADMGLVSMIRQGILALQLLPPNSSSGVIIITDGVASVPDVAVCETLLNQLRSATIACSFVQVGGAYSYDCSFGYVPNVELMKFVSLATFGSYLPSCPVVEPLSCCMNAYHHAFLTYSFLKTPESVNTEYFSISQQRLFNEHLVSASSNPALIMRRKKHAEKEVHAHLVSVVSVRLREGYTIREIGLTKGGTQLEVKLVLLWKHNMHIEYLASAPWPLDAFNRSTRVEVTMEGSYDILHDISCTQRKPITSPYRTSVIRRFWNTLQSINQTDQMLVHLQSFNSAPENYTIPESTKNGVPLFYIPPGSTTPVLSLQHSGSKDSAQLQFASYWKPVLSMDATFWQRWLHMHRIAIILEHDTPVPKHLHTAGNNGRYSTIQCRISHSALTSLLRDCSSFVLVEGYCYVRLICSSSDQPPSSFYLVRLISKTPCMVLRLGFPIGTPAHVRNKIVDELREQILRLRFPHRIQSKEATPKAKRKAGGGQPSPSRSPAVGPVPKPALSDRPCVVVLNKPLEKLLIRYEKLPLDFRTPFIFNMENISTPSGAAVPLSAAASRSASSTLASLSRYFLHRRWVWAVQSGGGTAVTMQAVAHVLSMLSELRLSEGFHFASSAEGIINMVMELPMKGPSTDGERELHLCTVQYILFPPHSASTKDSFSTDEDDGGEVEAADVEAELSLVTECWVEPQSGTATNRHHHLEGLEYRQIPDAIFPRDLDCVSTLMTFEYLKQMCHFKDLSCSPPARTRTTSDSAPQDDSIHMVPFHLDLIQLLPRCQQVELLFSTFSSPDSSETLPATPPNELLLGLFHASVEHELSDRRVALADGEHAAFVLHVLNREREGQAPPPFSLPAIREDTMTSFHTAGSSKDVMGSTSTLQSLSDGDLVEEELSCSTPQWRCYVRCVSSQQLLLTFLPSTFSDVVALMASRSEAEPQGSFGESTASSVQREEHHQDRQKQFKCPVYVYSCLLEHLKEQLVQTGSARQARDVYVRSLSLDRGAPSPWTDTLNHKEPASHCSLLMEHFHQSYVKGLYRALQQGIPVSSQDVLVAVDYCEESLQEVDITAFLQALCGHVRHGGEVAGQFQAKEECTTSGVPGVPLQLQPRCEACPNLHAIIQEKFYSILSQYFRIVPSSPHYYFYCPPSFKKDSEDGEVDRRNSEDPLSEAEQASEDGCCVLMESDTELVVEYEEPPLVSRSPSDSNTVNQDQDSFSILDGAESLMEAEPLPDMPPMFLHLTCSVNVKSRHGSTPIRTLPTCLVELISCLENSDAFQVEQLHLLSVTLDVFVLTLPPEIEIMNNFHHNRYTSESSVSLNRSPGQPSSYRSDEELMSVLDSLRGSGADSVSCDPFSKLPLPHKLAILTTTDEIRWLLEDEIVSALRRSPLVGAPTLRKVAAHVLRSVGRPHCRCEDVPLQFVFGSEQSLENFKEEFRRTSFHGYVLNSVQEGLYYVSLSRLHRHRIHKSVAATTTAATPDDADAPPKYPATPEPELMEATVTASEPGSPPKTPSSAGCMKLCPSRVQSMVSSQGSVDSDMRGYEGGSSDSECESPSPDEPDWRSPPMPDFWLMVEIHQDRVTVYSHSRCAASRGSGALHGWFTQRNDDDDEHLRLHRTVVRRIGDICRIVNQRMLLQDLHDSHVCNTLLVAESEEDIWKSDSLYRQRLNMSDDYSAEESYQARDYLAATMQFMPGHFACDVVWRTVIHIHPRLKMGPNMGVSRAMQALRSVLNSFCVVNRKNMFVYQERTTKSVFYLRLGETLLPEMPPDAGTPRGATPAQSQEDGSRNPKDGSRPPQDGSRSVGQMDKHILLLVHGVGTAGPEITDELLKVLRKRLDETTLDIITVMLLRNCKLTPADVEFIQPSGSASTEVMTFSLPPWLHPHLLAVAHYLRQNLLIFLHLPKYTDSNTAHHFKHYLHPSGDVADGEIYLYNKPGGQGTGGKGIACITLSFVDVQGRPLHLPMQDSAPHQKAVHGSGLLHPDHFEEITAVAVVTSGGNGATGAPELRVRFDVWEQGNVSPAQLSEKLQAALRHTVADLLMELHLLPHPLCLGGAHGEIRGHSLPEYSIRQGSSSRGVQAAGLGLSAGSGANLESTTPTGKSTRRSFWDILSKPDSSEVGGVKTTDDIVVERVEEGRAARRRHKTENVKQQSSQERTAEAEPSQRRAGFQLEQGNAGTLNPVFQDTCEPWINFMAKLGCPSVQMSSAQVSAHFLVPSVLSEIMSLVTSLAADTTVKAFEKTRCVAGSDIFLPVSFPQSSAPLPLSSPSFILIGRNFQQWSCSTEPDGGPDEGNAANRCTPHKGLQRFEALENSDGFGTAAAAIVPRQRLVFISVRDKKVTLYTYNWSLDVGGTLSSELLRLVRWQNARGHVAQCLFSQKMGLFHHCCFADAPTHHSHCKQDPNPFLGPSMEPDALLRSAVPPPSPSKDMGRPVPSGRSLAPLHFPSELLPFDEALRDVCASRGLADGDAVSRHGGQLLEIKAAERRELEKQMKIENLFVTWQQRSAQSNMPIAAADLETLKQSSRLVHYCATPLLFDPALRRHIQEEQAGCPPLKKRHRSNDSTASGRDRSYSADSADSAVAAAAVGGMALKEEPWLTEICSTFLQQYVQYLQSMGFILVQVRPQSPTRSVARSRALLLSSMSTEGRMSFSYVKQKSDDSSSPKVAASGSSAYHLQRALPGGIVLMELAFQGSYFCVKQYALECSRIPMGQTVNSQGGLLAKPRSKPFPDGAPVSDCALSMLFTEECDRVRDLMHVHSFSYDFHLRVVHQYLLGLQLTLRQAYDLRSFLDHFILLHPDVPKFGRNHVYQGTFSTSTGMITAHQLYNYVTDHAGSYGMKPLRMSRTSVTPDGKKPLPEPHEYALVSLWNSSGSYRDLEGLHRHDDFDVSLVVCHNAVPFEEQSDGERHLLRLRFYVIMTSQRELFPHLTADMRRFKKLPQIHREPLSGPEQDAWEEPRPSSSSLSSPGDGEDFYPLGDTAAVLPLFPLLGNEAAAARRQIQAGVEQAMGHCRRDNLWRRLFHGEHALDRLKLKLSFSELQELLEAVQSCSVGDIDPQLDGFLTMNPSWYQSLIKVLLTRFPQSCRHFDDGSVQYLAVLNQKFTDCFVLVFLDSPAGKTSLKVVFREPLPLQPRPGGTLPPQLVSMYHHLESVINAACFNLWSGLL